MFIPTCIKCMLNRLKTHAHMTWYELMSMFHANESLFRRILCNDVIVSFKDDSLSDKHRCFPPDSHIIITLYFIKYDAFDRLSGYIFSWLLFKANFNYCFENCIVVTKAY